MTRAAQIRADYTIAPIVLRQWHGIETNDPPFCRNDHVDLLAMAERMLDTRQRHFPKMVETRELDAGAAQAELATFGALVADWRWVVSGNGEPAHANTWAARATVLDQSVRTLAEMARDQGGFSTALATQAHWVIALRWWHELPNLLNLYATARLNHALRAGTFFQKEGKPHAA
jgi:hypothetical protein